MSLTSSHSPVFAGLVLNPLLRSPSAYGTGRTITPSAEEKVPKQSLVLLSPGVVSAGHESDNELSVVPYHAPKQLFPEGMAHVSHTYTITTHAHPIPTISSEEAPSFPWQTRHILLPYNLRDENVDLHADPVGNMLSSIFPGTKSFGRQLGHLNFWVEELPARPWPSTIGGLPIKIHDASEPIGVGPLFPWAPAGPGGIRICSDMDGLNAVFSSSDLRQLALKVGKEIQTRLADDTVMLIELLHTSERNFYVILSDQVDINKALPLLPGRIARCKAMYILDKDLCRPSWAKLPAKRDIEPQPDLGIVDNTVYDILRPGVMVCSMQHIHGHPMTLTTTTGVLVKNAAGDTFMTGASHGIGNDETMFQPMGDDQRSVGKAVQDISFTDVALIQLDSDRTFVNETFHNISGYVPNLVKLTGEDPDDRVRIGTQVYMNSPYTGDLNAEIVGTSTKLESEGHPHSTEARLRYVTYSWTFPGQVENPGTQTIPQGTCGSTLWDDDGVVVGFFRYYIFEGPLAGFSASVSASEVVDAGYRLA